MMNIKTKNGAASIYVVIVCTILFSVITIGFVTLTVNEMSKSSDFSLSESSLQSAEAGVEDVKLALAKCNGDGFVDTGGNCEKLFSTPSTGGSDPCDQTNNLVNLLGKDNDGSGVNVGISSASSTQAYTCIVVDPYKDDYLGTLNADNSVKIIPLQVHNKDGNDNGTVEKISISWYSLENLGGGSANYENKDNFDNNIANPPTISASIYETLTSGSINRYGLWLIPTDETSGVNSINKDTLVKSSKYDTDLTSITDYDNSRFQKIKCENSGAEYLCNVDIVIENNSARGNNEGDFLLVLSLPYQNPLTDFKVQMLDSRNSALEYDKVQISVDSTGRANDIYSRIETRLENSASFPVPEYAVTLLGNGTTLEKQFYVGSR